MPWSESRWRLAAYAAFGLYLAAQALPSFQSRPGDLGLNSGPGVMMTYLSFVGLFYDGSPLGRSQGIHGSDLLLLKSTCLMGAAVNVLIIVGSVSIWIRKYRFGFAAASAASVLAVLVLFAMERGRSLMIPHVGYICWAGSAGLLSYAAWKLSSPKASRKLPSEL
jgi:hypothetical protein